MAEIQSLSYSNKLIFIFYFSMTTLRQNVQKEDKEVKSTSVHVSQKDASKGFGGKYGVLKDRQDKVGMDHVTLLY